MKEIDVFIIFAHENSELFAYHEINARDYNYYDYLYFITAVDKEAVRYFRLQER